MLEEGNGLGSGKSQGIPSSPLYENLMIVYNKQLYADI